MNNFMISVKRFFRNKNTASSMPTKIIKNQGVSFCF